LNQQDRTNWLFSEPERQPSLPERQLAKKWHTQKGNSIKKKIAFLDLPFSIFRFDHVPVVATKNVWLKIYESIELDTLNPAVFF
jgi:hypothetical protein